MRRLSLFVAVFCLLAPSAAAQDTDLPGGDSPVSAQPGQMKLTLRSGLAVRGQLYVMRRQRVEVQGVVRPFVPGQQVEVVVRRGDRVVERMRRAIERAGDTGVFRLSFKPRTNGRYRVFARHAPTPQQEGFSARSRSVRAVTPSSNRGDRGTDVRLLHRGLRDLAYVAPGRRRYTNATERAVIAFQKVNRMGRTGRASRAVYEKLLRGRGGFRLKYPGRGRHVEFDLSRQVLVLANRRRAQRIYHSSSGARSTPTVRGGFRFYRKDRGRNSVGMVHSSYFHGGYAIHGYKSVPTYPASHGCLRVPIPDALSIFRWIDIGQRIWVYP